MTAQVVHDVARTQRGAQHLIEVGAQAGASMGPSRRPGAVSPSKRRAATNVGGPVLAAPERCSPLGFWYRLDFQDGTVRHVGRQVQQPVWPLPHIANPLTQLE